MKKTREIVGYEILLSGRPDGTLEAAYIHFKRGKSKQTQEIIEDSLLGDYDENGELLGLEILAPVKLSDLAKHVQESRRASFRRFVRRSAPAELVNVGRRRVAQV